MSDPVNSVKPGVPNWPVRPVTPATKDREAGNRKKQPPPPQSDADADDDERKSTIDEYI